MKIILTQEEIQDVLEEYVNSQISLAPGQSITVELVEDSGAFSAEVDVRNKTATAKPKGPISRKAKKAEPEIVAEPEELAEEPAVESTQTDEEVAEAVKKIDFGKTKEEVADTSEDTTEAEPEEKPVRKTASGKGSIFNFQNKA